MTMLLSPTEESLNLVDKLYQISIYPKALEVGKGNRLKSPVVVDLDPTTFCDLACPECISKNIINQGQFDKDRLITFAEELAASEVKAVVLIGGGEPLMHKSIGSVIEILHSAEIQIGLVTNGTLIHRYLDELATMLSWIRVSMDAATPETHGVFRPSGRETSVFPTIVGNMRKLASRKEGNLGYSFLLLYRTDKRGNVTCSNYHEVFAAGELAKDIGCDYLEVKVMFDDHHFIIPTPSELLDSLKDQLDALREIEDGSFHVLSSSTYDALIERRDRVQEKDYCRCRIVEMRTTVTPTGVYVCPYHRGNQAARIGDIYKQSFAELWASARTDIVNPKRDCRFHCARHESNLEIHKMANGQSVTPTREDYDLFM
jgi:MoaA/NifB/PqqE/SkfB family radical SAM enzyme